ncbi:hypothetical protein, partial [Archangium sp.]|uniref:hypothetical protein n=1 Tax=Archangium sp. TaxID=1872627 RepID=UPI002D3F5014
MAYRLWVMTPGAVDRATERDGSRGAGPGHSMARVSVALGASVALHVLGAMALWRGASEPESPRPGRPLEVRVIWLEAVGSAGPTGSRLSAPAAPAP